MQSSKIDLVNKNNPAKTTEKETLGFLSFVHKLGRESGRVNFMRNSRISLLKLGMTMKRMTSNNTTQFPRLGSVNCIHQSSAGTYGNDKPATCGHLGSAALHFLVQMLSVQNASGKLISVVFFFLFFFFMKLQPHIGKLQSSPF